MNQLQATPTNKQHQLAERLIERLQENPVFEKNWSAFILTSRHEKSSTVYFRNKNSKNQNFG